MPCDEWKRLAEKAEEARLQREYLASTEVIDLSNAQRKRKIRDQTRIYIRASRQADEHRQQCSVCKVEPPSHFSRDPDEDEEASSARLTS